MNPFVIAPQFAGRRRRRRRCCSLLARKLDLLQVRGDDAPIRVKGGSVKVRNDHYDWVTDKERGPRRISLPGAPEAVASRGME